MATIISQPAALSLAHNLGKFKISSATEIRFKLSLAGVALIDESYTPAFDNIIEIDVKDVVIQELSLALPDTVLFEQTNIVKTFSADINGTVVTFIAIRAGIENFSSTAATWLKNNWLTWQPQVKAVGSSQPEWLSYYTQEACKVKVKYYMSDKTTYVHLLATLAANKCYSINTQFQRIMSLHTGSKQGYFDIWVEDNAGVVLTYVQRYIYKETESTDEHFLFENSLGSLDTATFSGASIFVPESEFSTAIYNEESEQLESVINRFYQKSSGWKSKLEASWLWEIFRAKRVYKLDGGVIRKITIKDSSVNESSQDDMKSYEFIYRMALDKGLLNIPRSADPLPSNLEITTPEGLFFLAPRLVEFPDAEFIDEILIPTQSPYLQTWKKFSLGALKTWIATFVATSDIGTSSHTHTNKSILDKITSFLKKDDTGTVTDGSLFSGLRSRKEFLRKDVIDTAAERITFAKGLQTTDTTSPEFEPGFAGKGFSLRINEQGRAVLDVDELSVRQSAKFYELIIQQAKHQGGIVFYTAASMECISVTEQADSYRCFFDTKDGQIPNEWAVNDQARCQRFAGKYYWRLVVAVGTDYIDLSKADTNGAGVPEKGDIIVQLGNRADTARQAAKVTTVIGADAPRDEFYEGINSYDLTGKLITIVGMKDGKAGIYTTNGEFSGKVAIGAGSTGLTGLAEWEAETTAIKESAAQDTAEKIANIKVGAANLFGVKSSEEGGLLNAIEVRVDNSLIRCSEEYYTCDNI